MRKIEMFRRCAWHCTGAAVLFFAAGAQAQDSSSLRLSIEQENPGADVLINWNPPDGATSQLQYSTNLAAPGWMDLGAAASTNAASDPASEETRFYRVRAELYVDPLGTGDLAVGGTVFSFQGEMTPGGSVKRTFRNGPNGRLELVFTVNGDGTYGLEYRALDPTNGQPLDEGTLAEADPGQPLNEAIKQATTFYAEQYLTNPFWVDAIRLFGDEYTLLQNSQAQDNIRRRWFYSPDRKATIQFLRTADNQYGWSTVYSRKSTQNDILATNAATSNLVSAAVVSAESWIQNKLLLLNFGHPWQPGSALGGGAAPANTNRFVYVGGQRYDVVYSDVGNGSGWEQAFYNGAEDLTLWFFPHNGQRWVTLYSERFTGINGKGVGSHYPGYVVQLGGEADNAAGDVVLIDDIDNYVAKHSSKSALGTVKHTVFSSDYGPGVTMSGDVTDRLSAGDLLRVGNRVIRVSHIEYRTTVSGIVFNDTAIYHKDQAVLTQRRVSLIL